MEGNVKIKNWRQLCGDRDNAIRRHVANILPCDVLFILPRWAFKRRFLTE